MIGKRRIFGHGVVDDNSISWSLIKNNNSFSMCLDTRFASIGILIVPSHMVKIAHGIYLRKGSIDGMALWIRLLGVLSKGGSGFLAVKVEVTIGYGSGGVDEEVPIDCLTVVVEAILSVYEPNCQKQYQHLHHLINVILKYKWVDDQHRTFPPGDCHLTSVVIPGSILILWTLRSKVVYCTPSKSYIPA